MRGCGLTFFRPTRAHDVVLSISAQTVEHLTNLGAFSNELHCMLLQNTLTHGLLGISFVGKERNGRVGDAWW